MCALLALRSVLALFGLGFAVKARWILAVIGLVVWAIGFAVRSGERRWYRG